MSAIILVALPVFAVIAAGFAAGRLRLAGAEDSAALNRFVFRFAMPAALFGVMSGAEGVQRADAILALAYGASALALQFAAYRIARTAFSLPRPEAGAHAFASSMGNAVFLGLPIALAITEWTRPFVTLMLVEGIIVMATGAALMSAPPGGAAGAFAAARGFLLRPLTNPIVAAALAGFAFAAAGVTLPDPVRAFFDILGRAAGPTALFSLGLFLATRALAPARETAGKIAAIAVVKMAALPAATLLLARALGVDDDALLGAAALFTVTPTAVGAFVMASQYEHYVRETVAAIAVTTALSVLTISIVLALYT